MKETVKEFIKMGGLMMPIYHSGAPLLGSWWVDPLIEGELCIVASSNAGTVVYDILGKEMSSEENSINKKIILVAIRSAGEIFLEDCVFYNGSWLFNKPIAERKYLVERAGNSLNLRKIHDAPLGLMKGFIYKKGESLYKPGERSPDWVYRYIPKEEV